MLLQLKVFRRRLSANFRGPRCEWLLCQFLFGLVKDEEVRCILSGLERASRRICQSFDFMVVYSGRKIISRLQACQRGDHWLRNVLLLATLAPIRCVHACIAALNPVFLFRNVHIDFPHQIGAPLHITFDRPRVRHQCPLSFGHNGFFDPLILLLYTCRLQVLQVLIAETQRLIE